MYLSVIVPAAGSGKRMTCGRGAVHAKLPKQFWPLGPVPLIVHSLRACDASPLVREVIIACAPRYVPYCRRDIVKRFGIRKVTAIVPGGAERHDTVERALTRVSRRATHVAVHDAVRPFVTPAMIRSLAGALGDADGVIVARPVVPTLKKVDTGAREILGTIDRRELWEAETPQLFKKDVLVRAYREARARRFKGTDDASLVEAIGGTVRVMRCDDMNIKVTTPDDYRRAGQLLTGGALRVGFGTDIHRLVAGRALVIGGVRIPSAVGCLGHSDGDPLLHALIDALLGAAGLGDIGEHFSDRDRRFKNIKSTLLLKRTLALVSKQGLAPLALDAVVMLERPKLSPYKERIRRQVATLMGCDCARINIKAKTNEGLDAIGRGEAIGAAAVVTVQPSGV